MRTKNPKGDMTTRWGAGVPERLDAMCTRRSKRSVGDLLRSIVLPELEADEKRAALDVRSATPKRGKGK